MKGDELHQSSTVSATDALKEVWGMQEGELYMLKDGELKHLPRSDDLPKVPVSEAARDALLQVRRKCRKALGGFRPDLALVTSALVLYACEREPIAIVVDHFHEVMPAVPADDRVSGEPIDDARKSSTGAHLGASDLDDA